MKATTLGDKISRFNFREEVTRYGVFRTVLRALVGFLNTRFWCDCLYIIALERDPNLPRDAEDFHRFSSRFATAHELEELARDPRCGDWLDNGNDTGSRCLLNFCGGQLAGFTWVHLDGRPRLYPGLRISIPANYAYNHDGYTMPEFRGRGLQSYRHRALLTHPELADRSGLIGFVKFTNWNSQRGQAKSGYRTLGTLFMVGPKKRYAVLLSPRLKRMGIRRLPDEAACNRPVDVQVDPLQA